MTATLQKTATEQESPQVEQRRRALTEGRLLVLAAIIMSALTLRVAVTAFSPLAERIGADVGYGTAVVGVFGMIPTAMFALSGLLTPVLVRRFGLERTALLAMLMAGTGQLVRVLLSGTAELLVFSALALAGMGIGNVVIPPLVKRYFADRVAVVSSLYIMMVQLGTVVPAFVAVPIADGHGWRISLGLWAVLGFAAAVPWIGVLRDRRGREVVDTTALGAADAPRTGRVWRSPVAWGMAGMFGMTSLITYAMFTWLPKILSDAGASAGFGGSMLGLFAVVGLVAALSAPAVVTRFRNPFPVVVGCAVFFVVSFAGLLIAPMSAPILWVVLLGLGPSTFPMALTLINLRTNTPGGSAALSGFTQGVGYAVACVGPLLFGVLHSMTDGWGVPFALLAVAVLVLLAGAWQACKPRMLEDTWN
ncbi:CP family cyanate transporter-like MFS transporter [Nocardia tenerifensis]|uniref:CP family cyanate transporter-like MFS transporter n=1 Tax=Nocardia tenerifensis TaxID=228006 RepID=A0A318KKT9_9NOCA|nr:MFS transporter [Nocardia tenerifensis]PXX69037.1 CP family cyanate transporter-like MFS transporter [Nocardia tenerifensis]